MLIGVPKDRPGPLQVAPTGHCADFAKRPGHMGTTQQTKPSNLEVMAAWLKRTDAQNPVAKD